MIKKEFCERIGITDRYFRYLLQKERDASLQISRRIARALNCEPRVFWAGTAKQRQAAWKKAAKERP